MKNNVLVVGLLTLVIGLFIGYTVAPRTMMDTDDMAEMHESMGEMVVSKDAMMQHSMDQMMVGLEGKQGEEYEKAFLEMMIVHHIGAIEMAEDLLTQTQRPELVKMANDIITVQNQEVEMMRNWLKVWFNA